MFEVAICNGRGEVLRRFDLSRLVSGGRKVLIGRGEDCDIRIRNDTISRRHLEIEAIEEDEWVVRDAGSTHGSFVGEERLTEAEITAGMEVRVGPAVLRFTPVSARIASDLERELGE